MKTERHQQLVQLVEQYNNLTTQQLAQLLGVSQETVRRDLRVLQKQGKIVRQHGRAKRINRGADESGDPFTARLKSHLNSKADIAHRALAWIVPGMVIALDASSTCWYLARLLPDIPLTVFTNSERICQALSRREHIKLISTGGLLQRKYACYINAPLAAHLKSMDIDLFLFSCEGVDSDGTLWDTRSWNAEYKTMLLKRSAQSLLLIDKSKFDRVSEVRIGEQADVTEIISEGEHTLTPYKCGVL
ncbi:MULTISPECIES: L-fucose operon activator [Buttiauxella]|jgi:DeoR family L-fucose operon activator|uniref:L-fucose operon activator n=1 Tax=Buttiauxella ferragutiae ATCC 51602 TaxID=1354252 RepID=A0ABX2WEI9_9ENTR|nr:MULTISPECIES: L-fucose operon activator [Buttiauxella]AYN27617.1 L-fucose operon activator [Buttiauxella sp. 3AFRM03]MCE0826376.1 L-fucose operon activator [Buttiauxella ferragutiae]OAT33441.1 L-fucose operon activator [Buttiauxella ferragutiae ATCC 51602]TDN50614.1 DeoR family transcriptional regulator [Buttiauxella sp. JUb87]UNK60718.1 L-fucose operon activator [Buttiauxella ferragutiae]